jgi:hypothetical protein
MTRKIHWRLHTWEPIAACKRKNDILPCGTPTPWIVLSDGIDPVTCKSCLKYFKKSCS